jgi:small-conductance mechanosensitive channel
MSSGAVHKDWFQFIIEWRTVGAPLVVFLLCFIGGLLLRTILFRLIRRWSRRSGFGFDSAIISATRTPILIWSLILGIDLAGRTSVLPRQFVEPVQIALTVLWIVSITIVLAQLAATLVRLRSARIVGKGKPPTLTANIAQMVISILGLLFLLNQLRVDIRPALTALGVGGIGVALALQGTLANLFAGLYISVSSQIRVGDYIKLATGEEGFVSDITWRSTTLRSISNSLIFIPNAKLAQEIITNFSLPVPRMGISITVRVGFEEDLDRAEGLILDEALGRPLDGLIVDPPPFVLLSQPIGESFIPMTLNFEVTDFAKQFRVQSELRKRILKRFRSEGIVMPYPIQTWVTKTG